MSMWSLRPSLNREEEERLTNLAINLKSNDTNTANKKKGQAGSVMELPELQDALSSTREGDLPEFYSTSPEFKEEKSYWYCKYLIIAVLALNLGLALWGVIDKPNEEFNNGNTDISPTGFSPETSPLVNAKVLELQEYLPESTWQTLQEDKDSPQAQAFVWVQAHPDFKQMPLFRMQQLMAMATLIYAKTDYIPIAFNECQWHVVGAKCDEEGKLTTLELIHPNGRKWTIPPEISLLTSLTRLQMTDKEYLTGTVPTEVGALTALTHLFLFQNQLEGSLPTQLGQLTDLRNMVLSNTQLKGSLPEQLGELTQLTELHLGFNQFDGSLPGWLSQLAELKVLKLGKNQFDGPLPKELGDMTALHELSAESNRFTGRLPTEWAGLSELGVLQLFDNQLTGSIPTALTQMTRLEAVYLHQNKLTGAIPSDTLGHLHMLEVLKLHRNALTGTVDSDVCDLLRLTTVSVDCEEVTCICEQQCICGRDEEQ